MAFSQRQRQFSEGQLPVGVAAPHIVLASQPISVSDITLVSNCSINAHDLLLMDDRLIRFSAPIFFIETTVRRD